MLLLNHKISNRYTTAISLAIAKSLFKIPYVKYGYDPASPLLGIYQSNFKINVHTKTYRLMLSSLPMIVKAWKQPRCPQ